MEIVCFFQNPNKLKSKKIRLDIPYVRKNGGLNFCQKFSPKVKQKLWGGEFWTDGYFASTVGKHGNKDMIGKYVKNQGCQYQQIHKDMQLKLF